MDKKSLAVIFALVITILLFAFLAKSLRQAPLKNTVITPPSSFGSPSPVPTATTGYFYPLSNYFSRIKFKKFGQLVKATDKFPYPCGTNFAGYHDGDDLEATSAEQNIVVPVHAVAAGRVLQVGHVTGYGGLLVQSANLNGPVTIYYGHISLTSVKVKTGDNLTAGQIIANLGSGCSRETDGERKHLHFAIHEGSEIDVRGYVPDVNELGRWLNPAETLKNLGPAQP